jgi:hypothetical protein
MSQPEISQPTPQLNSLEKLNQTISNITDEGSAIEALEGLESFANKRAKSSFSILSQSGGSFSIQPEMKMRLARAEVSMRSPSGGFRTASIDEEASVEDYIRLRQEESTRGLSSQEVADALNDAVKSAPLTVNSVGAKVATAISPYTVNDVELMREKALESLPAVGNKGTDRISPMEALVIAYSAASDDDGTQPDGQVAIYANQDQLNKFVAKIAE